MGIRSHKTFGSLLLVAGTAIGAGMLALPLTTVMGGFYLSALLFIACFIYMMISSFLVLEANFWSHSLEASIVTMVRDRLGFVGQMAAWLSFLLLLYAVAAAYLTGGGSLITQIGQVLLPAHFSEPVGMWLFAIVFGVMLLLPTRFIDVLNRFFMMGLFVGYFVLIVFLSPHITPGRLVEVHRPLALLVALPVVILSFTAQIIVPTLRTYLGGNEAQLKRALWMGMVIPLLVYLVWELMIFGALPYRGANSLMSIARGAAHPIAAMTAALHGHYGLPFIAVAVGCFSFFALMTSFVGVGLSLMDFLADGFGIRKTLRGRIVLMLITMVPPLLFALFYPTGFIFALGYAGVFVAVLYGILTPLMVWKGRYVEHLDAHHRVFGGRPLLVVMLIGGVLIIYFQVAATLHWIM